MILTETTLNQAVSIILKYIASNSKVVNYQTANVLKKKLDLTLPDDGFALEELMLVVEYYLHYSVRTGLTFHGISESPSK